MTDRTSKTMTTRERLASRVVQNVCELPDYTSPDDQPDLVMCKVQELEACVLRAFEEIEECSGVETSDAQRIDFLERWVSHSRSRGFHWDTFTFKVDGPTVREQLDQQMKAGMVELEKSSSVEPRRDDPNAPFRWTCPKCTTVNGIADEVCLGGSCGTKRPEKASGEPPGLICSKCGVDRLKATCPNHFIGCPMHGTAGGHPDG